MLCAELDSATKQIQPSDAELDWLYLAAELGCIDLRLRRAVLLWQRAGQDPDDPFLGMYVSDEEAMNLLDLPLNGNWGDIAQLQPEEETLFDALLKNARQEVENILLLYQARNQTPHLQLLAERFGLDRFAMDAFLICLAPAIDLRYEKLYGYLQDDISRKRPSANMVLDLLCRNGSCRQQRLHYFGAAAPLFKHCLLERVVEPGRGYPSTLNQALVVNEVVVHWLVDHYQPQPEHSDEITLTSHEETEENRLLAGDFKPFLLDMSDNPLIAFCGPDETAQVAAAHMLAAYNHLPLLRVNLAWLVEQGVTPLEGVRLALRDARLTGALLFLPGWDLCLEEYAPPQPLFTAVCAHPGAVIVAGAVRWQAHNHRLRRIRWHTFPTPDYHQRLALWQQFLPVNVASGLDVRAVAGQFQLTTGQIRDVVQAATDRAAQNGTSLTLADLFVAARAYSNPRLSSLARKIIPRYTWNDIVLPEDQLAQLHELVDTVRQRPIVLDEWGLGQKLVSSRGVAALFSGPPGTGKTMAAEVIAGELGLDLYKIDLSSIVSKYIGETEKNLERIFSEAETSNAILFFDEADALFGKRSEVRDSHDRYANIEISYLLQRMEAYDGVTILATNLRANLDEAFTRRLQFTINFPFPDRQQRQRIWQALLPPEVPREKNLDMAGLAQQRLAGGSIRNILVSGTYRAASDGQPLSTELLERSLRRELQKMGRWLGGAEPFPDCNHQNGERS
jgi:hypothetical protein